MCFCVCFCWHKIRHNVGKVLHVTGIAQLIQNGISMMTNCFTSYLATVLLRVRRVNKRTVTVSSERVVCTWYIHLSCVRVQ